MGIENEIKYILDNRRATEIRDAAAKFGERHAIQQAYIGGEAGIRLDNGVPVFTYHKDGHSFELPISEEDFARLISLVPTTPKNGHTILLPNDGARLRVSSNPTDIERYFTYKRDVDGKLVEIESKTAVDVPVFEQWWAKGRNLVCKERFKFLDEHDITWDSDFLIQDHHIYWSMSEAEMPTEDMEEPPVVLPLVDKYVIYKVHKNDSRFTNKKLADRAYAEKMLARIYNGTVDKGRSMT